MSWFRKKKKEPPHAAAAGGQPTTEDGDGGGYFIRLKKQLSKTRRHFTDGLDRIFFGEAQISSRLLEDLEELLITSDIGVQASMDLIGRISRSGSDDPAGIRTLLRAEILALLSRNSAADAPTSPEKPHVVMVVGVNGVGKTTTIGKLAAQAAASGRSVLVAAADTFRAAAVEQVSVWAERAGAEIVKHKEGADPAAVAYDAVEAAMARGIDTVIVDTAGRLHTKVNLMEELKKIKRSISKKVPGAPQEILLVLDATTGQNAIPQARMFHEALGVTGLVLTKLDGTAKGGIVIAVCSELNIPLKYIGIGEKIEDLQAFDAEGFVEALF